jgi:hypothetical protein
MIVRTSRIAIGRRCEFLGHWSNVLFRPKSEPSLSFSSPVAASKQVPSFHMDGPCVNTGHVTRQTGIDC